LAASIMSSASITLIVFLQDNLAAGFAPAVQNVTSEPAC
jgi:hypothetical protein